ncbi:MAG: MBL fold metallo-hydrolase [Chloroflexota bacterium]
MQRERVADDVYVFTSEMYAQVTAGAVVTPFGSILIDTLPFPEEAQDAKTFLENRLSAPVRFVILTHYHADHTNGAYLFPNAVTVSHELCRSLLDTFGREGLADANARLPGMAEVEIGLPELVFNQGELTVRLGDYSARLVHSPGHSPDSVLVEIPEVNILFAGDTLMPIPTIFDGDFEQMIESLSKIPDFGAHNVIQGHGEVVLKGEIGRIVESDKEYLRTIQSRVSELVDSGAGMEALVDIDIESCGKSRIPLNGLVTDLHMANLHYVYQEKIGARR